VFTYYKNIYCSINPSEDVENLGRNTLVFESDWDKLPHLRKVAKSQPSVKKSGAQSGANTCATWWTKRWAIASVRFPTSIASSSLLSGSTATQTHWDNRSRRSMASAALTSPTLTALRRANNTSSWTWLT